MKKLSVVLVLLLLVVTGVVFYLQLGGKSKEEFIVKPSEERVINVEQTIRKATPTPVVTTETVKIDFGGSKVITGEVRALNAYDALSKLAEKNAVKIETKQYKFGSIVEKIGDKGNNNQYAWIYYVNGKTAEYAADKYVVRAGDLIEWKYSKIN